MEQKLTLRSSLRYLKGVGPERLKILGKLGLEALEDIFYFFPRRYENRSPITPIASLLPGEKVCTQGTVAARALIRTRYGQSIFRLSLTDMGSTLFAVWFKQPYLLKVFSLQSRVTLYGKAEREGRHFKMVHPEFELTAPGTVSAHNGRIVPIYSLTEDLYQKSLLFGQ